jgi:ADP-ribosylglycohydrolase
VSEGHRSAISRLTFSSQSRISSRGKRSCEDRPYHMTPDTRDRYRGALLGLAAGDALGTTLEFQPPGSCNPITTMIGGGPFNLKHREWTDDCSMALCPGESLIECGGFDPVDQMQHALLGANLGDDADTTAALYGQFAGADYGAEVIPAGWLSLLLMREFITEMADSLLALSENVAAPKKGEVSTSG